MSRIGTFPLNPVKLYLNGYETCQACNRSHGTDILLRKSW